MDRYCNLRNGQSVMRMLAFMALGGLMFNGVLLALPDAEAMKANAALQKQQAEQAQAAQAEIDTSINANKAFLLDATKPGSTYEGLITTRESQSQALTLIFTQQKGFLIQGYFYNPSEPQQKRTFKGILVFEINENPEFFPIQLDLGPGYDGDRVWDIYRISSSMNLRAGQNVLEGKSYGVRVKLEKVNHVTGGLPVANMTTTPPAPPSTNSNTPAASTGSQVKLFKQGDFPTNTGTIYKIPDLMKLVDMPLKNAWLIGTFICKQPGVNAGEFRTYRKPSGLFGVDTIGGEGTTIVLIQFPGGWDNNVTAEKVIDVGPLSPLQLVSVERNNGMLLVKCISLLAP